MPRIIVMYALEQVVLEQVAPVKTHPPTYIHTLYRVISPKTKPTDLEDPPRIVIYV